MKKKSNLLKLLVGGAAVAGVAAAVALRASRYPGVKLKKCITVDRSPEELYRYWRNFENLPKFMDMLHSVEVLNEHYSHWAVLGPGGLRFSWDAEITIDRANEMIGWQSLKGSIIDTAGYVRFEHAAGGRGTTVRVALQYVPPARKIGAVLATLLGKRPGGHIEQALRRFKQLMETGEIATAKSRPSRRGVAVFRRPAIARPAESVEEASEESFPASDPPAWTGTTGTGH